MANVVETKKSTRIEMRNVTHVFSYLRGIIVVLTHENCFENIITHTEIKRSKQTNNDDKAQFNRWLINSVGDRLG